VTGRRLSIVVITVLTVSALVATSFEIPPSVAATSTLTVSLIGFISSWNATTAPNPTITVLQGETLTIQLSSGDGATHQFFVDVDKSGPAPNCSGADICSTLFPPSTVLTFTVNFAPGTYTYYCSIHPTTMFGGFVVVGSPAPVGGGRPPLRM